MKFEIAYHSEIKTDLSAIDEKMKERIKAAIEIRLTTAPHQYGVPLRKNLKGYWKLRVGDYRVVFKIEKNEIWIFGIIHRKKAYEVVIPCCIQDDIEAAGRRRRRRTVLVR